MSLKVLQFLLFLRFIVCDKERFDNCLNFFAKDTIINNQTNDFVNICSSLQYHEQNDVLFVLTTCNHLKYTIQALETLRRSADSFDLIVIDDFSIDGTPDYLIKKGYAVITKSAPHGLTHSWNVGYR